MLVLIILAVLFHNDHFLYYGTFLITTCEDNWVLLDLKGYICIGVSQIRWEKSLVNLVYIVEHFGLQVNLNLINSVKKASNTNLLM